MPVAHGHRSAERPSARGGFVCLVCNAKISEGDPVVGFRNANKAAAIGWDHVCAKPCADQYKIPTLGAAAPSTSAQVADRATGATAASSRQPSDDDALKTSYFSTAQRLDFTVRQATVIVQECEGNFEEATQRLGDLYLQNCAEERDDGDLGDADGSNDDQGGSSGEEETLPEKPLAR